MSIILIFLICWEQGDSYLFRRWGFFHLPKGGFFLTGEGWLLEPNFCFDCSSNVVQSGSSLGTKLQLSLHRRSSEKNGENTCFPKGFESMCRKFHKVDLWMWAWVMWSAHYRVLMLYSDRFEQVCSILGFELRHYQQPFPRCYFAHSRWRCRTKPLRTNLLQMHRCHEGNRISTWESF